jgi:glycosyltransferase involved in cell wall biosynthesis
MGDVDEETMNDLYRTSDVWCHPCTGGELFGISGVKAQAAGCIPVIIPTMALKETVKNGYFATRENYQDTLISCLDTDNTELRNKLSQEHYVDWEESTRKLLEIIQTVI